MRQVQGRHPNLRPFSGCWEPGSDSQVKSASNVESIYDDVVGHNAVLMLNVPPDRRGLFTNAELALLQDFGQQINGTYQGNLAQGRLLPRLHPTPVIRRTWRWMATPQHTSSRHRARPRR